MRWHEHPIAQTSLVLAVMAGVISVQNVFVTQLFPQTTNNAKAADLSMVAAVGGCPVPALDGVEQGHPTFEPGVAEADPFNNFGPAISGLSKASASKQKFESVIPADKIDSGRIKLGTLLDGTIDLVEAMTPSGSYANKNPERPSDGVVIKIKTTPGQVIKAPDSGRKISGSGERYIGMVMYATADGVRFANSRNDKPNGTEGYNLYIWGINTDPSVVSNYRKGHDEFKRKCFPQFKPGDKIGTAKGDFIYLALRDNGDFVTIRDTSWWDGKVTNGQGSSGGGTTATPTAGGGGNPTTIPTGGQESGNAFQSLSVGNGITKEGTQLTVPFCWTLKQNVKKSEVTTSLAQFRELNLKINSKVAEFQFPVLNTSLKDFTTLVTQKYQGLADAAFAQPTTHCENLKLQISSLSSFGVSPYRFQIVPANTVANINLPVTEYAYESSYPNCTSPNPFPCDKAKVCVPDQNTCNNVPNGTSPSVAPTIVPTSQPTSPAPTLAPTALPTISSTGTYTRIELTRDELRDAGGVIQALPGDINNQIIWYFDNCGLPDALYSIHENAGDGSKIAEATCEKINDNKILLTGFSINKKNIILAVKLKSQRKYLGGIVWNIR